MDPQHRLFLECAWHALEHAGYNAEAEEKDIGLFAGVGMGTYLLYNLSPNPDVMSSRGFLQTLVGADKDYLATRVSYKLNLTGPSAIVGTACSSSLVATHLACQSLLGGECDMAVAAGVAVKVPQAGLTLSPDEIASPDGHCRAFDARANGTVGGNGLGAVVLKRLEDAIADRDTIYATIAGSAVNNDGAAKVGYTAPSQAGQTKVIRAAQAMAEVEPKSITYMEAHGTGTPLGDPIEVAAMTQAFRASTDEKGYCAIGSVKTNVGHLDAAAGIAGLLKTTLALHHKLLPPSLNFETPNPEIDFDSSPFYVNTELKAWDANGFPRRAGLSSFGFGGTNVHMVLEEAPPREPSSSSRSHQLLLLSAKTPTALDATTENLVRHLQQHPDANLADVAYTLQIGRKAFAHRRMAVCSTSEDAIASFAVTQNVLGSHRRDGCLDSEDISDRPVVFMFSGQGAQYPNMARGLYDNEPLFRETCDRCFELLEPLLGFDLRQAIYPDDDELERAAQRLQQTAIAQPALFVIEYALAQLWMSWGVRPAAAIGHSIGEYVAACLAGVFSLEEGLALVVARGKLMQQLPGGSMLSVNLPAEKVVPLLGNSLEVAASNAPMLTVVSGPTDAVDALEQQLAQKEIGCRRLHTSHAFHSAAMEAIAAPFTQEVQKVRLHPLQIPLISNVTGTWTTAAEATDPHYWARHLRQTVRFAEGIAELLQDPERVFLEVGPGRTLKTLTQQQAADRVALSSLRHPKEQRFDEAFLLDTLGQLWLAGVRIDWQRFYADETRDRIPLPTYPFERQRYWIDPPEPSARDVSPSTRTVAARPQAASNDMADWFYIPSWRRSLAPLEGKLASPSNFLVFIGETGIGAQLVERLQQQGHQAIAVCIGSEFAERQTGEFCLNPDRPEDYDALLGVLRDRGTLPEAIVHLWLLTPEREVSLEYQHNIALRSRGGFDSAQPPLAYSSPSGIEGNDVSTEQSDFSSISDNWGYCTGSLELEALDATQNRGFYSLLFLAQALGKQTGLGATNVTVVSNHLQSVIGDEPICPEKATVLGPINTIAEEYPHIRCCSIDVTLSRPESPWENALAEQLLQEITVPSDDAIAAYRGWHRWVQTIEPVRLERGLEEEPVLRQGGVYLITGGLGGIGLTLAEHLAKTVQAKLVLVGRSPLPDRNTRSDYLETGGDRIDRALQKIVALEALGSEVLTIRADVTDLEEMEGAIAQAESTFGPINGVIHAAGVPGGGVMQRKTRQDVEAILAPKVKGTLVLEAALRKSEPDFLVLCSSLASTIPIVGQVDYAAANAFLDAFARAKTASSGTFVTCINWDAWKDVGMAAEAAKQASPASSKESAPATPIGHPLFEYCQQRDEGSMQYVAKLAPERHWVLDEHRLDGRSLLPGTAYLEMVRAAWAHYANEETVELQNVCFLAPWLADGEKEARVLLKPKEDGFAFQIQSPVDSRSGDWEDRAIGAIATPPPAAPRTFDLQGLKTACSPQNQSDSDELPEGLTDGPIKFGPRWQTLQWIRWHGTQGLALLALPEEFRGDLSAYRLHPALLDFATGFLMMCLRKEDVAYLPFSYRRLTVKGALPARIYSHVRWLDPSPNLVPGDTLKFDIVLADERGVECVDIEEYALRRIDR